MNMKSTSNTICTLLALVLLLNPVQVFARALFLNVSTLNAVNQLESFDAETASLASASKQVLSENCHEDMQAVTGSSLSEQIEDLNPQNNNIDSKMVHSAHAKSADLLDCCKHDCSCSDSACHSFSLIIQSNPFSFVDSSQQYDFNLSLYISLASSPGSPPPIV